MNQSELLIMLIILAVGMCIIILILMGVLLRMQVKAMKINI